MTRFIHRPKPIKPQDTTVYLTISGVYGHYSGSYSTRSLIFHDLSADITIKIVNKTLDGISVKIDNYASTGVAGSNDPIDNFTVKHCGQSATFTLNLLEHQLIDFGVFVVIETEGKTEPTILFCDPQASNDPIKTP
jgi:hypothetical protein